MIVDVADRIDGNAGPDGYDRTDDERDMGFPDYYGDIDDVVADADADGGDGDGDRDRR